jgi:8-oxo-dGTP diphosphatase
MIMTTIDRAAPMRQVYFHDPGAPPATVVVPSVFVVVRRRGGGLLLVRRCDSGVWELPGGQVDVGETAVQTAVRETAEEAGISVSVTGIVGLFTDPGHVVRSPGGLVRQQFVVVLRAEALGGLPHGDLHETAEAAWVAVAELPGLRMEAPVRGWIAQARAEDESAHLG